MYRSIRFAATMFAMFACLALTPLRLQAANPPSSMTKRLVLCLDGTWASAYNETKRRTGDTVLKPANPLKLCRAVEPLDRANNRAQLAYYHIGVGGRDVYPGLSNLLLQRVDRVLGGAWGAGFEENVEDSLTFLALNFESGDEVFIFGFSRGAATARAVTRFLDWNHGLPEKEDVYYLPRLFRRFVAARGDASVHAKEVDDINNHRRERERNEDHPNGLPPLKRFRPVAVKYLGVWDTVMALGSRFEASGVSTSTDSRTFYGGDIPAECVEHARQALAI